MITELRLENWKSFGEATLYIDSLSILIGTNASGKSNVLEALQFLNSMLHGKIKDSVAAMRGGNDWLIKKPSTSARLSVTVDRVYECAIVFDVVDGDLRIKNQTIKINGIIKFESKFNQQFVILEAYNDEHDLELFHALENMFYSLSNITLLNPVPKNMRGFSPVLVKLKEDASNIAGVLAVLSPERQQEVEEVLTQYARRLPESEIQRVYAEKVGKLGKDAMLYCDEKWGESGEIFTVDARAMSDGTLRFLAILTALLTLPEGSLLAIDEVDNGFHPSRAYLLLEALQTIGKQRNIDVLVTTHNPALLDALGTEFVPFVTVAHRDSITGESKLTLLEDIEQLPKLLAQGTVGKLSTQGLIEKSLESVHG
jgi:predicted ATPase